MHSALRHFLGSLLVLTACATSSPPAHEPEPPAPAPTSAPAPAPDTSPAGEGAASSANEKMCGGIAGIQCAAKQYCNYAPEAHCGAADMSGTCQPVPDLCTQQVDEVCGCNDKTYSNACMAAQAGVSVVMKGACALAPSASPIAEGQLCGTRGVPGQCAEGLYCAYKSDCGATDAGGTCRKKPNICTKIYAPVCGCDEKTYASDCTAAGAGVSVKSKGKCPGG